MICHSCDSNSGKKRISPAATIYEGRYWLLEHAFPTSLPGWLVIVKKRHTENLHDLNLEEWRELSEFQYLAVRSLNELFDTDREYTCCFAEVEGFKHIHFNVIPKYPSATADSTGTKVFSHLKVTSEESIQPDRIIEISDRIRIHISKIKKEIEI